MDTNQEGAALAFVPPVDIVENGEGIVLTADLPGVSRENLSVDIDGDTLTFSGRVTPGRTGSEDSVYAEHRVASYRRTFVLSRDLDASRIEATMKDGVLTLRLPKAERAKPRRVQVLSD